VEQDIKYAGHETKDAAITVKDKTEEGAEALKNKLEKEWKEKWLL